MDHITQIVDSAAFERLIGMAEDPVLEVKVAPYDLEEAADRYELAKDVSSLANAAGGYLLVGIKTSREPDAALDVIEAIVPVAEGAFPVGQYEGVVRDHVYPAIAGLRVRWIRIGDSAAGVGVIHVPPQHPDMGPFLIMKVVADNRYLKQIVVGYAERQGSSNEPLPPRKLYTALKQGRDTHSQRLARIEAMIDRLIENSVDPGPEHTRDSNLLRSRMDSMRSDHEGNPVYVLAASIAAGNRVRQFFNDESDGARYLLLDPPHYRYAGFDLRTLDTPHSGPDDCWEVRQGDRKLLRLYNDGTLIFGAPADGRYLGWGVRPDQFLSFPRLNPVPVVETHASFTHLYAKVLERLKSVPTEIHFTLTLGGGVWDQKRLFLTKYYGVPTSQVVDPPKYVINADPAVNELVVLPTRLKEEPNRVAYTLVAAFADLFDMPHDLIPFVKGVGDKKEIDIDQIIQL